MISIIEKITPGRMLSRFEEISVQRSDLRVLLYIVGQQKIVEWIHSVGVCEDELLRSLVPPLPPQELRAITAAPDLQEFLWTGLVDTVQIMTLYEGVTAHNYQSLPTVLDFGCGCGRITRFLNDYPEKWSVHGCEVNAQHVRWCQDNLRGIKSIQCGATPPLPYDERMFDLIYGISVFTHLSEDRALKWLIEMRRVLTPNGILIITTHGEPALKIIRDSPAHQVMFNVDRRFAVDTLEKFRDESFVYRRYNQAALENASAGDEYGNAFIQPDYIFAKWQMEGLKVIQYLPGGLRGWQDIVILQRTTDGVV